LGHERSPVGMKRLHCSSATRSRISNCYARETLT
jgi:hypothetical protein